VQVHPRLQIVNTQRSGATVFSNALDFSDIFVNNITHNKQPLPALQISALKGSCLNELERRRSPRFTLQESVILSYKNGEALEVSAVTENASLRGALVRADVFIPVGRRVEVTILLKQESWPIKTRLRGMGKVVRVEERGPAEFLIAIGYDEPLAARIKGGISPGLAAGSTERE
jgi:PilZ domain